MTQSCEELEKRGISLADSLRLLHATDSKGKLHIGVDAFILIWSQLDRWRVLGRLVSLPPVRKVADLIYVAFADKRFKKLEHCQIAARKGWISVESYFNSILWLSSEKTYKCLTSICLIGLKCRISGKVSNFVVRQSICFVGMSPLSPPLNLLSWLVFCYLHSYDGPW